MKGIITVLAILLALIGGYLLNDQMEQDACRVFNLFELGLAIIILIVILALFVFGTIMVYLGAKDGVKGYKIAKDNGTYKTPLVRLSDYKKRFEKPTWEDIKVLVGVILVMFIAPLVMVGLLHGVKFAYLYIKSMYC